MTATSHDTSPTETPAQPAGRWSDMSRRLLTIAIGVPLVLAVVVIGTPLVEFALLFLATFVIIELAHMIDPTSRRDAIWGIVGVWITFYAAYQKLVWPLAVVAGVILFIGLIRMLWQRQTLRVWITRYTALVLGVFYTGISFGLLATFPQAQSGREWIIYILFITWTTDSFALLGGRVFGRRKLAPKISPSKTIEGAFVGYVCGALMGLIVALLAQLPLALAVPGLLLLPIMVICGDLLESWLKRYYEVKDSGSFLPGHGGFFDRVDGLMLAIPMLYLILSLGSIL